MLQFTHTAMEATGIRGCPSIILYISIIQISKLYVGYLQALPELICARVIYALLECHCHVDNTLSALSHVSHSFMGYFG